MSVKPYAAAFSNCRMILHLLVHFMD